MKQVLQLMILAAFAASFAGCRTAPAPDDGKRDIPLILSSGWSGEAAPQLCAVQKGSTVEIRLDANATTGYSWQCTPSGNADAVALENHAYFTPESRRDLCGAPGVDVWRFRAAKEGRAVLTFRYYRNWQKFQPGRDAERIFTIVVTD